MNDFRPDWLGAVGAGVAALLSFAIAKSLVDRTRRRTAFYLVLGLSTFVLSLAIREALRFLCI